MSEEMKQDGDRSLFIQDRFLLQQTPSCRGEMKDDGDKVAAEWVHSGFSDSYT